jgi:hypothetical protein
VRFQNYCLSLVESSSQIFSPQFLNCRGKTTILELDDNELPLPQEPSLVVQSIQTSLNPKLETLHNAPPAQSLGEEDGQRWVNPEDVPMRMMSVMIPLIVISFRHCSSLRLVKSHGEGPGKRIVNQLNHTFCLQPSLSSLSLLGIGLSWGPCIVRKRSPGGQVRSETNRRVFFTAERAMGVW